MGDIRNCRDVDEHLAPYVDGEETEDTLRSVDAHLAACPPCRDHAEAESTAREMVRQNRDALCARAPEALRAKCAGLHGQSPTGHRHSAILRKWMPLSLAATLVLAVAGVFLVGLNDRVEALAASLAIDHVKCFKVGRGAPLSVYVLQGNAGGDRVVDRMGRETVIWCTNRRTYAVVADGHPADLT